MVNERRYRDAEVREIFEMATRPGFGDLPVRSEAEGFTLVELQNIGREVGLDPAAVANAAAALDHSATTLPPRRSWGMPIGVGRIVPLPRPLTDFEWERLVAELRATFGARGRVFSEGGLREWVNGNLHACVEPAEGGYRLRLGTVKGDAAPLNAVGAVGVVAGAITFGALLASGGVQEALFLPWMISGSGVAAVGANLLRLPRWARRREEQMNQVAAKVVAIMKVEPPSDSGVYDV